MKNRRIYGVFRGFPGLGRVVAGVSLMEQLRDKYGFEIRVKSYLQGNLYLESRGYHIENTIDPRDLCSIGIVPTHKLGVQILREIKEFCPDAVIIDGEPLVLQLIKILFPKIKVIALLNPSDVDNPSNDMESMAFFCHYYGLADLSIIHGLQIISPTSSRMISIPTILRHEILNISNYPKSKVYCILGGGTVNVGKDFESNTIQIGRLCIEAAKILNHLDFTVLCASENVAHQLNKVSTPNNVTIQSAIKDAVEYYEDASVIITRSGRNSLSELAFLGVPAISFVCGDAFRREEQKRNIENLHIDSILCGDQNMSPIELSNLIQKLSNLKHNSNSFSPGNEMAICKIISFFESI